MYQRFAPVGDAPVVQGLAYLHEAVPPKPSSGTTPSPPERAPGQSPSVGRSFTPSPDLDADIAEGGLGAEEEAPRSGFPHSPHNVLRKIFAVELVHALDDGFHELASGGVVGVLGDGHYPDALAPEHGLEGYGVFPLPGEAAELPDEDYLKWGVGWLPSSIISLNWGRSATRPLSASSTYSRATE